MFEQSRLQKIASRVPSAIVIPLFGIMAMGIINLSSAASATRPDLYLGQIGKLVFALSLGAIAALTHTRVIRRSAFIIYAMSIGLLVLVLLLGVAVKGAERWLVLGPLRIQPSDPAKIGLVLAIARYCSLHWPHRGYTIFSLVRPLNISRPIGFLALMVFLLVKAQHGSNILSAKQLTSSLGASLMCGLLVVGLIWLFLAFLKFHHDRFNFVSLIAPIDIALLPSLLIAIEPDLGTSLIVLGIAGIMFLYIGIRRVSLLICAVSIVAIGILSYNILLRDYQKQRVITFLNPSEDIRGDGYHAMQSVIAVGSGRLMGKGYHGGTQTQLSFLPENATDFVFSVWAEEWGFIACVFLLGLYFIMLRAILNIINRINDRFSELVCIGVAAIIFLHVIINIGMVTGLMPVVGVPLPLMSYGGSSSAVILICLGLAINVALFRGEN